MKYCTNPQLCGDLDCDDCDFVKEVPDPEECKTCGLYEKGCDQECEICPGINK